MRIQTNCQLCIGIMYFYYFYTDIRITVVESGIKFAKTFFRQ